MVNATRLSRILQRRCLSLGVPSRKRSHASRPFSNWYAMQRPSRLRPSIHAQVVDATNDKCACVLRDRRWLSSSDNGSRRSLLTVSNIAEPPLDSDVVEKPCTVILMEDIHHQISIDNEHNDAAKTSWLPTFESKLPTQFGMSFGSISFQHGEDDNSAPITSVKDCVNALKASQLSRIHDAVLVARGPFSSICAQYYLESLPLQGLVLVDPILLGDDDYDDLSLKNILSNQNVDEENLEHFR